ncbi:LOW QUALITY PROTEIN: probable serine/threonine-protein kinase DDB_G0280133 [Panonychus citri]|uniref:LOW QUALITY PROTEIN: probable serine/threonine-protein kinase DDB_G0280133 n=1 Tax=Panonychus citri TaxID=50023 RepID=UPI0023072307|nr:LOW QUALITY PROTEIN: probable serine/threonine-protein kinase DDB_G0280133 [Panonychus citri]
MSMTISYHPSDFISFRSCPTRLIIQRIVIILCIIYLSYCQLVQSKLINQRKVENNPIDPMVFDTRQRLTSTNQHLIINSTTNKPKLCRYYPTTINKNQQLDPKNQTYHNQNSYHNEIELTSSLSLIATINKLSSPPISSSQLVKPNQLPINYDQNISNSVYLNSSNGLIPINSQLSPQLDPPSSQHHHRRRHEKHRNQQQHQQHQQQQQLQQLNQSQQSKCHTIKVHRSRKIYLQSSCSKNHIHISGKTVRATKTQHLIDNAFYVTGIGIRGVKGHGQLVHFKGLMTGKFICYNKKGKIVAKDNGQWDISCIFREISKYNKYKYRSFYNDNWFLGFDYKGRPIRGTINRHEPQRNGSRRQHIGQHCYEFSKIKIN